MNQNFKFKGGRKPPPGVMQQGKRVQANINIPIDTLDDIICANCEGKLFIQTFAIKYLPVIYSPDNKEGTINALTGPMCVTCGQIANVRRQSTGERDENLKSAEEKKIKEAEDEAVREKYREKENKE